jgi:hypothetical protein
MLYYLFPYVFLVLIQFVFYMLPPAYKNLTNAKLLFFIGLIPTFLVVCFRGDVGTDTWNYLGMAETLIQGGDASGLDVELGFLVFLKGLVLFFHSPRFVVNFISLLILVYAYGLFSKSIQRMFIFSVLIYPVFFFDMSMNGLRYGLAFLLAKHASDCLSSNRGRAAMVLLILAISMQMSSILVFILLQANKIKISHIKYLLPVTLIFIVFFQERLLYKYSAYQTLESAGPLSGLLPLLLFVTTYCVLTLLSKAFSKKLFLLLVIEVASFSLASVTYAGLRFQLLALFALFCFVSDIRFDKYTHKKAVITLLCIVGFVGFLGKMRNFSDGADLPPSPFLPYHFYWEAL